MQPNSSPWYAMTAIGGTASWFLIAALLLPFVGNLLARAVWPGNVAMVGSLSLGLLVAAAWLAWSRGRRFAHRAGAGQDIRPLALLGGMVALVSIAEKTEGVLTGLMTALPFGLPLLTFWLGARPPREVGDRRPTLAQRCRFLVVWLVLLAHAFSLAILGAAVDGVWLGEAGTVAAGAAYLVSATVTFAVLGRWLRRRWRDDPVSPVLVLAPALLFLAPMLLPDVIDRPGVLAMAAALLLPPVVAFTVSLLGLPRRRAA